MENEGTFLHITLLRTFIQRGLFLRGAASLRTSMKIDKAVAPRFACAPAPTSSIFMLRLHTLLSPRGKGNDGVISPD